MLKKIYRTKKPRNSGITSIIDEGTPFEIMKQYILENHENIDFFKFGQGTAYNTPNLKKKINFLKTHDIKPYFGGSLFEKFISENKLKEYLNFLRKNKIDTIEISNGTIDLSLKKRAEITKKISKEFLVLCEVGSKNENKQLKISDWIKEISLLIEAGSEYIILEGRNSGTAGIFEKNGKLKEKLVNKIVKNFKKEKLIIECPIHKYQMYLINLLGPNVNLGNINLRDMVLLECQRLRLRSETFFEKK